MEGQSPAVDLTGSYKLAWDDIQQISSLYGVPMPRRLIAWSGKIQDWDRARGFER
jgi:hypothetical protein